MGELGRRRARREVVLSRGQVAAAGVTVAGLLVGAFAAGALWGDPRGESVTRERGILQGRADESLVELIARVEVSRDPSAGVQSLSYPDALRNEVQPTPGPVQAAPTVGQAEVEAAWSGLPAGALEDVPPVGPWAISLGRFQDAAALEGARSASLAVPGLWWQRVVMVEGISYRDAGIGGLASESEALEGLALLSDAGALGPDGDAKAFAVQP